MHIGRRQILGSAGAAAMVLAAPLPLRASTGPRVFELYRGSSQIGRQVLDVTRDGSRLDVAVDIDIAVRILGLPAYRYTLSSREVWVDGRLQALEGRTDDDGEAHRVSVTRQGGVLMVDGSGYSGPVEGEPATTTYWAKSFLKRDEWISTQDGKPLDISAQPAGRTEVPVPGGATEAESWAVRGDIGVLDLFYDAQGEWVGNRFEARGEQARFVLAERGRDLAGLL
ncbi:hypothetical protein HMH01_06335 [Halovulum dunhuangense]|uniref:Uncharacterized protein n=1 Tax=Halovulum dunhuangense TaxID=1505036 RepID=A0A849L1B5_9RHOB|nr:DUF6134 family protein [Halovulum dunhuangense]NNU80054.1 hypothetical protein [Halovulum dunhuangense]